MHEQSRGPYRGDVILEWTEVLCYPLPDLFDHQLLGCVEAVLVVVKGKRSSREPLPSVVSRRFVAVEVQVELVASTWLGGKLGQALGVEDGGLEVGNGTAMANGFRQDGSGRRRVRNVKLHERHGIRRMLQG